jgi:hypothetical protein
MACPDAMIARQSDADTRTDVVVAVLTTLLVLGPALGRGIVLAYDMPWSPDARLGPFAIGVGVPAPRAVPGDAVTVVLGSLIGPAAAQKAVLCGVLVLLGCGCSRLLAEVHPSVAAAGRVAAGLAAVWSAFVAERLIVGQWTVLLGYAVLPWLLVAVVRARHRGDGAGSVALWIALAGCGGANTLAVAGLAVLGLVIPPVRARVLVVACVVWFGSAAVWAIPALDAAVVARGGVEEFRPSADMPLGVIAALLTGGGNWNPASHPMSRAVPVVAIATLAWCLVAATAALRRLARRDSAPIVVVAVVGLAIPVFAVVGGRLWSTLVLELPGGGVFRDAQKFVAGWMLVVALGTGVVADHLWRHRHVLAKPAGVTWMLLPVAVLPALAWGIGGRLVPTTVPTDYRVAASALSAEPPGLVGVLPWGQYRRYAWNGSRVSLTLLPRLVDQQTLYDDSLPLRAGPVPGEDPRAARVTAAIASGVDPVVALRAEGVRYVALEARTGLGDGRVPSGRVISAGSSLTVVEINRSAAAPAGAGPALRLGWLITGLTWLFVVGGWLHRVAPWSRRRLLPFEP